jgi:hypothetical protein
MQCRSYEIGCMAIVNFWQTLALGENPEPSKLKPTYSQNETAIFWFFGKRTKKPPDWSAVFKGGQLS